MDHEKTLEATRNVAIAAAKEVPMLGTTLKIAMAVRDGFLGGADKSLEDWMRDEVRDSVLRRLPDVERRMDALERAGVGPTVTDFAHVANAFARAWSAGVDPKKRELLEAAFVRSFDRDLYESGLLNTLWDRLERLNYGDLHFLRELIEAQADGERLQTFVKSFRDGGTLGAFHVLNLTKEGLVYGTVGQLETTRATELGKRLRDLAWSLLPEPGQTEHQGKG